jgi:hypothetical protein
MEGILTAASSEKTKSALEPERSSHPDYVKTKVAAAEIRREGKPRDTSRSFYIPRTRLFRTVCCSTDLLPEPYFSTRGKKKAIFFGSDSQRHDPRKKSAGRFGLSFLVFSEVQFFTVEFS